MPTYTYRCNNCEYQFDIKQRMADDPLTDCPECETDQSLRKVLNSVGIVFKGSGFYVTDSRGKKTAAASAANGKSSEDGEGTKGEGTKGDGTKTDTTAKETSSDKSSQNGSDTGKKEKTAA